MKAELIIIENDADLADTIALEETLMAQATDAADIARLRAQARLVEDYERHRWPHKVPSARQLLAYLMDQHGVFQADISADRLV